MPQDEEEVAFEAVANKLRAQGHVVTVLGRPDREERPQRAVDFEIDFDGNLVAVEITSASQFTAEFVEAARFETALEDELRPFVEEHQLGHLVLRLDYQGRLRKRDVPALVARVATEAEAALLKLDGTSDTVELSAPSPLASVEITRIAPTPHSVHRISSPVPGYFVEGTVDEFIDALLASKATQAADYVDAWIIIFSRTGVFSAASLAEGVGRRRGDIPKNWRRVYYVEGTSVMEVLQADPTA
jgi:hypothetical protein